MRGKSPLALMEQTIMIAVFALSAALCLKAFVWADLESMRNVNTDRAVSHAQAAAELLKGSSGDYSFVAGELGGETGDAQQGEVSIFYDREWTAGGDGNSEFILTAKPVAAPCAGLESAAIEVTDAYGSVLVSFNVSWQGGESDGQ